MHLLTPLTYYQVTIIIVIIVSINLASINKSLNWDKARPDRRVRIDNKYYTKLFIILTVTIKALSPQ